MWEWLRSRMFGQTWTEHESVRTSPFAIELADRGMADLAQRALAEEGGRRFGSAVGLEPRRPL